ncbi:hypothetical protein LJR066_002800 [Acidovorax sp. LjRoot66]|uniref:hypothetical protein n=1 Tax=Acidovorax sp. LjRoot66 TaxID=3342334 RepID=UPI003ECF742D
MSAAHTPGPWVADGVRVDAENGNVQRIAVCHFAEVGSNWAGTDFSQRQAANARLISAAPELLDLAKRWDALDSGAWHADRHEAERRELIADTRALIAKATGGAA